MFVIIEGNEGSGKTTLANEFARMLGVEVKHRSKPETEEERQTMYRDYLEDITTLENAVWDRGFYSEMVYGPIMRDQSYIDYPQMREFEQLLASKGAFIIYCRPEPYIAFKRAQERGEDYVTDFETYEKIQIAYDDLFRVVSHGIPILEHR